jgi:hypothetical protein
MPSGGKRNGAGRKSKADELALIERLSPLDDAAFAALEEGIEAREFAYIKMFFEYRFGKPNEKVDVTTNGNDINTVQIFQIPDNGRDKSNKAATRISAKGAKQ